MAQSRVFDEYDELTDDMRPQQNREYETLDREEQNGPIVLQPVMTGEYFTRVTQYPVIVEQWEKCVGRSAGGRYKRGWLKWFSESERAKLSKQITRLRTWYLVRGVPQRVVLRTSTIQLLQKASNFFANLDHYCSREVMEQHPRGGPNG